VISRGGGGVPRVPPVFTPMYVNDSSVNICLNMPTQKVDIDGDFMRRKPTGKCLNLCLVYQLNWNTAVYRDFCVAYRMHKNSP